MYALQETIRPSADLRNHYNEVSKQCRENNEAVIRFRDCYFVYEEDKRMKARIELLEILAESDEDVKYDRVAPMKETFDDLRRMIKEG